MNAIVNIAPGRLEWQDLPTPQPGPGQVRIRTAACGICATDLEMIAGPPDWQRTRCPAVPGHEWSGFVDAVGPGVAGRLIGRPCVAENVLSDGGEVGFEHPGGYGQFLLTEAANVQLLPDGFPPAVATLIEPLAVCVRATRRLRSGQQPQKQEDATVVFGDGPIGLLLTMLLRQGGPAVGRLVLVGGRPSRLALAGNGQPGGLGADAVVDYHAAGGDLAAAIRQAVGGLAISSVVEASGSASACVTAWAIAAHGARILLVGDYGTARADFAWLQLLHREFELIGSNASAAAWPEAVRIAGQRADLLARLVTHRLPAGRFADGLALVRDRGSGAIKVVLDWS